MISAKTIINGQIQTIRGGIAPVGGTGNFTALDLTPETDITALENGAYPVNTGATVVILGEDKPISKGAIIYKDDNSVTIYDNDVVKYNLNVEMQTFSAVEQDIETIFNAYPSFGSSKTEDGRVINGNKTWGYTGVTKTNAEMTFKIQSPRVGLSGMNGYLIIGSYGEATEGNLPPVVYVALATKVYPDDAHESYSEFYKGRAYIRDGAGTATHAFDPATGDGAANFPVNVKYTNRTYEAAESPETAPTINFVSTSIEQNETTGRYYPQTPANWRRNRKASGETEGINTPYYKVVKRGKKLTVYVDRNDDATTFDEIITYDNCDYFGFVCSSSNEFSGLIDVHVTVPKTDIKEEPFSDKQTVNRFRNKVFLAVGASTTERNAKALKPWTHWLTEWLGCRIHNDGRSGTGLVKSYGGNSGFVARLANYAYEETPDIILIYGNANDFGGTPAISSIGTLEEALALESDDVTTQHNAVVTYIRKLIAKYPLAKIGWMTSAPSYTKPEMLFEEPCQAIKEVCEYFSIPCLDLYHESGLVPWMHTAESEYAIKYYKPDTGSTDSPDLQHYNSAGHELLAHKMYDFIVKNF